MNPISGFIIICLILTFGYGIGLLNFLNDFELDKCDMTFMFEYPQYVRISNKIDKKFRKYGLYAYSEGRLTYSARNMYFTGIPVLFIPGNAGSHKQVRSLSSLALRKAISSKTPYHFDYFTVDLNNEFSGLYGPLLYDQLEYINSSLYRIFEVYSERRNKPTSLVIIGHSMGGVVAKNLLSLTDPNLISIVITLAAPLKRPPIALDYHVHNFYDKNQWSIPENSKTTIVSLSGGHSDFLIPSFLSDIKENNFLYVVTTNIPRSWTESNHVQIVWCKQTLLALSRALFDSVDKQTKQISTNATYRNTVFNHHLIHNSGINIRYRDAYTNTVQLNHKGQWIESLLRQYSLEFLKGLQETHWYMVKLVGLPDHEMLTVLAVNLEVVDWVFACNANFPKGPTRVCTEAIHLTHLSEIAPSAKYKRRYFQINMHELRRNNSELTHVVFRGLPTNEPVVFHVDIYSSAERTITVDLPKWWSLQKHIIVEKTINSAVHYDLVLPQLQHIIQFYQLFVEPIRCDKEEHHGSASLIVPWSHENQHAYFTNTEKKPFNVRLYGSRPLSASAQSASIRLTLEPSCTYRISIKSSLTGRLGQMARAYTSLLLPNIAAVVLLTFRSQVRHLKTGQCSIFFAAIKEGAKPYYVLPFAKMFSKLFGGSGFEGFLPKPDIAYLVEDAIDFLVLPFLLYLTSVGIVWLLAIIFSISLVVLESTVHKLALKLLARTVSFTVSWSDYLMSILHKVPFIVAGCLISISLSTCGGLALCLGAIFYFLKLTQMSQDYIEKVVWFVVKNFSKRCKKALSRRKPEVKEESDVKSNEEVECIEDINTDEGAAVSKRTDSGDIKELGVNNVDVGENLVEKKGSEVEDDNEDKIKNEIKESDAHNKQKHALNKTNEEEKGKQTKQLIKKVKKEQILEQNSEQSRIEQSDDQNDLASRDQNDEAIKGEKPEEVNELSDAYNAIFFHSTLFFLWCIITVINIPAVLTWAHNFKFSKVLAPDDSFIPGITLSLCALPLWQFDFPKPDRKWYNILEIFVLVIAVLGLMYAPISVYRLNYLLTLTMVVITLHQLFAPKTDDSIEELDGSNESENDVKKYKEMKAKVE